MCLAEKAIALVGQHLRGRRAGRQPTSKPAKAWPWPRRLAGLAFSNVGVALVHALEYPLGGAVHCSHGAGNGLLLPYVMRYNLPTRLPEFARIAALAGRKHRRPARAASRRTGHHRRRANPRRHRHSAADSRSGATREQLPVLAEKAFAIKRLMGTNPRQPTQQDLLEILAGRLVTSVGACGVKTSVGACKNHRDRPRAHFSG